MHMENGKNPSPVFAVESVNGRFALQPGGVYWWPVDSAQEGERVLEQIDGAVTPAPGRLFYRGRDLAAFSRKKWLSYLARTAFLTPSGDLIGNLPVQENLLVSTFPDGKTARRELLERIDTEAARGLCGDPPSRESFLRSLPYRLQLVDRARAAVLRAVLRGAEWIVRTDEPPGLEPESREEYHRLLTHLKQRLPSSPWLFICDRSELPEAFAPFTTLPKIIA